MKTLLLPVIFLLSTLTVIGQNDYDLLTKWDYRRSTKVHEKVNKLIATTNGYIIAVGETVGPSYQDANGFFLIIDVETGRELMRKSFGDGDNQSFNSAIQNHDGTFTLVGYAETGKRGNKSGWVVRIDLEGNILFEAKPESVDKREAEIKDVAIDAEGNILAIGALTDKKLTDLWLLSIQQDKVSQRIMGNGAFGTAEAIVAAPDRGFVLVGSTDLSNREHPEDAWAMKVDREGHDLWGGARYFGDSGFQEALGITTTLDGGYAFVGVTNSGGAGLADHWLVKLDENGEMEWHQTYGKAQEDAANAVIELSEGGFAIFGQTKSYMPKATRTMLEVILTNERGQKVESETYPIIGGEEDDIASSLVELYNGDIVLAGNSTIKKEEKSVPYISAFTYKAITRSPNRVEINPGNEFSSSKSPSTSIAIASSNFSDANSNHYLEAGERGYIAVQIQNTTNKNISNVTGAISLEEETGALEYWKDIKLGTLRAGQSKQLNVPVHARQSLSKGSYNFYIRVESDDTQPTSTIASIKSNQPEPAVLVINRQSFLPQTNHQAGQPIMLEVELVNTGGVASENIQADFIIPPGVQSLNSERLVIPSLRPRQKHTLTFSFSYGPDYQQSAIPITFQTLSRNIRPLKKTFSLPLDNIPQETPQPGGTAGTVMMAWSSPDPSDYQSRTIEVSQRDVDIRVIALSKKPLQKNKFTQLINGKRAKGQKMDEVKLGPPREAGGNVQQTYSNRVRLNQGINQIQVLYEDEDGKEVTSPMLTLNYIPAENPNLYVLSIGVKHSDLKYTVKDARDIASEFVKLRDDKGRGFKKVEVYRLTTEEETTQRNIQKSFADLSQMKIKDNDLVVVFISSHGKIGSRGNYILMPSDYESGYEQQTSIDFKTDVLDQLRLIKGKVLVMIDACHSGSAINGSRSFSDEAASSVMNRLIKASSGVEIIASCDDQQYSYEDDSWGNGAFTKAIIEALRNEQVEVDGKMIHADIYHDINQKMAGSDGVITIEELRQFISQRVPYLVKKTKNKEQTPSHKSTERLAQDLGIYMVTSN